MYAKVENSTIVKVNSSLASFNNAAPSWSAEQLVANGIYEVVYDSTNLKDNRFYINGAESFTFANDVVTASYAAAVGKTIDDVNAVDQEGNAILDSDGVQIITSGVKTKEKNQIKAQAAGQLQSTDWYAMRIAASSSAIPGNVWACRTAVRTKSNEMETAIDNATTIEAVEALFTYTVGADDVTSRPLGEWPTL